MITRLAGISTGLGYLVGSGYEGKTKELDNAVLRIAKLLQKTFGKEIEIRFNFDRESGGAFIKDNDFSDRIGIGASLRSSEFLRMTDAEKMELPIEEYRKLPKDIILYHVVLKEGLLKSSCEKDNYKKFKTIKGALNWILKNMDVDLVREYLTAIKLPPVPAEGDLDD